jgi:hypothetical protein
MQTFEIYRSKLNLQCPVSGVTADPHSADPHINVRPSRPFHILATEPPESTVQAKLVRISLQVNLSLQKSITSIISNHIRVHGTARHAFLVLTCCRTNSEQHKYFANLPLMPTPVHSLKPSPFPRASLTLHLGKTASPT